MVSDPAMAFLGGLVLLGLLYSLLSSVWVFFRERKKRKFEKALRISDAWERRGPIKNPRGRNPRRRDV
ncbi:MAG: hypothetical protein ACRBB0_16525 [Pelagimonas sp.]|uniref:hypothetical protein n=1 Tax=Pelagimonas sp. TaxID=2073170 RepID=UPI003D6A4483